MKAFSIQEIYNELELKCNVCVSLEMVAAMF